MNLDRSDTLSPENRKAISSLTVDLQSIIDRAVPLLSREVHAELEDVSNSIRKELIEEAVKAQTKRRNELQEFLKDHALNDVYRKIHDRIIANSEELQEAAEFVINSTQDDTLTLLWLQGELFGSIDPNNYEADVKFILAQKDRIVDLLPFLFDTYIKISPSEENIFYNRTHEALRKLMSFVTMNPPLEPDVAAEGFNAVVRSTNITLSHVS